MIRLILIALLIPLLARCGGGRSLFQEILPAYTAKTYLAPLGQVDHPYFVSVAKDRDILYLANYKDVVKIENGTATRMVPLKNDGSPLNAWAPTGLFWHSPSSLLYVANYPYNNLLWFRVSGPNLFLAGEISHPQMRSPENIFVSEDGFTAVTANYDSGNVTVFDVRQGRLLWAAHAAYAHGAVILGEYVIGTSLGDRGIYVWRLEDGALVNKRESRGWEPGSFLWPTGMTLGARPGTVLVSDAHTGMIQEFSVPNLSYRYIMGRNGPGKERWNMPYGIHQQDGAVYITSTYGGQLLEVDLNTLAVKRVLYVDGFLRKQSVADLRRECGESVPLGAEYNDYVRTSPVTINQNIFYPAYKQLVSQQDGSILWISEQWYFVHSISTARGPLLFPSTSVKEGILYGPDGLKESVSLPSTDCWSICGDRLACPDGVFTP